MKRSLLFLSVGILVAGICTSNMFVNDSQVFAGPVAEKVDQKKSAVEPEDENVWTLGIYTGATPFELSDPAEVTNPVLRPEDVTDLEVDILAHPFMLVEDSEYYMFFTAKHSKLKQGGIGLAQSGNGLDWKYSQIVLDEPYDLSYPYVFKWGDDYYMIPEAHTETSLRLYRATDFPTEWKYERDLLSGDHYISASVVRYKGKWWMFVCRPGNETLRLLYASELAGAWTEHPESPIVEKNLDTARPGGRPIVVDGTLYRIGQDCYPTYGNQLYAYEIFEIGTRKYFEVAMESPLVKASSEGWNSEAMHHVDLHQVNDTLWIAAVDALGKK